MLSDPSPSGPSVRKPTSVKIAYHPANHGEEPGRPGGEFEMRDMGTHPQPTTSNEEHPNTPSEDDREDETNYPTGLHLYSAIAVLAIVPVTLGLDFTLVVVAVPSISNTFQSLSDIGWYVTTLRLFMCSFMFLAAKAYTVFSTKILFFSSVALFTLGTVLSTFAPSSWTFILGRAICGLGAAGINSGFWVIFMLCVPLRRRALYGSVAGSIETVFSVAAPLIGGALIDAFSWRACFGMLIPLCIIALVLIWFLLPTQVQQRNTELEGSTLKQKLKAMDLLGTAVFVPGIVCLLLALQMAGTLYGWDNPRIIVLFSLAGICMTIFGWWQHKSGDHAMLPVRILGQRSMLAGAWFGACANGTLAVVENYLTIYFQGVRSYSAAKSGILSLPMVIGLALSCLLAGVGTTAIGYYYPFMIATTLLAPVATGLLTTLNLDSNLAQMLCYQGLLGFAVGLGIQGPQLAAQTVLATKDATIGMAVVMFGSQMGPVLFVSASATLFKNRLHAEIGQYFTGANATSLDDMGLSGMRSRIGEGRLRDVLTGYDEAVTQTLYLPLALTCLILFGTIAMERVPVKKKRS